MAEISGTASPVVRTKIFGLYIGHCQYGRKISGTGSGCALSDFTSPTTPMISYQERSWIFDQGNVLPKGLLVGEESSYEAFVHDCHGRRIERVGFGEVAPAQE